MISGLYLACTLVSVVIIAFFVDPLSRFKKVDISEVCDKKEKKEEVSDLQLLSATFKQFGRKEQILLIPINLWVGMERGFFGADFTTVS